METVFGCVDLLPSYLLISAEIRKLPLSGHHLCLKHDFFMIDEHQDFIPIFVCIHGNLSKCSQTEDQTGCGRDRCRDTQKFV